MPSATHAEDDDPVIASYDVFITPTPSADRVNTTSNLYVLQYPSHRPSSKPYNDERSQKPVALRLKPKTGIVEIDVPLFTNENYNTNKGAQFGNALAETRASHAASGYGLSGGFNNNQNTYQNVNMQDVPQHGDQGQLLSTQTLGGKATTSTDRDPVYMLASLHNGAMHLSHLDGVVQMRPQLHHLDARDELANRKAQSAKVKQGFETQPVKLETRAIEMKIKDTKEDAKDRNLNANAKLLREIQMDTWKMHDWIDEHSEASLAAFEKHTRAPPMKGAGVKPDLSTLPSLKSTVDNDEWLDKMSSPGIELRTRLKGRDRERARRKRQERLRLSKAEASNTNALTTGPFVEGSATESSSDEDGEVEPAEVTGERDAPIIKSEIELGNTESTAEPSVQSGSTSTPKKRGRPKKNQATGTVEID